MMKKTWLILMAFCITFVFISCTQSPQGMAKIVIQTADQHLDSSRDNFLKKISDFEPKLEKMTRPTSGYVDIVFSLKDNTKIKVRFVDTPPNQTVFMIQSAF